MNIISKTTSGILILSVPFMVWSGEKSFLADGSVARPNDAGKTLGKDGSVTRPNDAGKPLGKDGSVTRPNCTERLEGAVARTLLAGYPGTLETLGNPQSNKFALYGIWSQERKDKPCYFRTDFEDVTNSSNDREQEIDLCGGNGPTSSSIFVEYPDGKSYGDKVFITGLKLCMNNAETRIKGFRVRAKAIEHCELVDIEDDTESNLNSSSHDYDGYAELVYSDTRTNCSNWKDWIDCPEGHLATAVKVHYSAGQEPRSITGIGFECRQLSKQY